MGLLTVVLKVILTAQSMVVFRAMEWRDGGPPGGRLQDERRHRPHGEDPGEADIHPVCLRLHHPGMFGIKKTLKPYFPTSYICVNRQVISLFFASSFCSIFEYHDESGKRSINWVVLLYCVFFLILGIVYFIKTCTLIMEGQNISCMLQTCRSEDFQLPKCLSQYCFNFRSTLEDALFHRGGQHTIEEKRKINILIER